jgi:hypothetical protein
MTPKPGQWFITGRRTLACMKEGGMFLDYCNPARPQSLFFVKYSKHFGARRLATKQEIKQRKYLGD